MLPRWVRILGWLVIVAVIIGIVSWLQGLDEDLRRALVAECQAAGREDCRFEQRGTSRRPLTTANGYSPADGIEGYSRSIPVLKQLAAAFGGLLLGNRLFGRRPFAK